MNGPTTVLLYLLVQKLETWDNFLKNCSFIVFIVSPKSHKILLQETYSSLTLKLAINIYMLLSRAVAASLVRLVRFQPDHLYLARGIAN